MKDRYAYPALFCYDRPGQVGVVFPDLPGCVSHANDEGEALYMAKDAMSLHLFGMEKDGDDIPAPPPVKELKYEPDQAPVLIDIFMPPFRERMKNRAVTKAVTVPRWLELEAKAAGLNFSQVLQDALMDRLGIHREITRRTTPAPHKQPSETTAA